MGSATASWGSRPRAVAGSATCAASLLRVVDAGLCGVIFVAPYFFGGRHDFGRLVFVTIVAITAVAWFARQALLPVARWSRTWAYAVLALAIGLVTLQIVPLPAQWLATVSPRTGQLLPLWTAHGEGGVTLGTWQTISLIPHETSKALAMLVSYSLLFLVVVGRIEERADVERLLQWIAASAAIMAVLGVMQYLTSDGKFFWIYEHPHRLATQSLAGPFINRNHFADFLVLGLGPLASWWLLSATNARAVVQRPLEAAQRVELVTMWIVSAATALVVLTILASRSRGGVLAMLAAGTVLVAVYFIRGLVDRRFMLGVVGLAGVVGGLLSIHGYDHVVERLDDFADGSMDNIDHEGMRRTVWAANVAAIETGWISGAGVGSHCELCPVYLPRSFTKEYTHAENGYLQIASEAGGAGILLLVATLGFVGLWSARCFRFGNDAQSIRLFGATAAGLAASALHSAVDFVWYIPACMSLVVVLAGCLLRLSQLACASGDGSSAARKVLPRGRWMELTAATILFGSWSVHTFFGPGVAAIYWDRYLRASVSNSELSRQRMTALVANRPDVETNNQGPLNHVMLRELEQVLRWDPLFARAHLRLAAKCLAQFDIEQAHAENAMTLAQVCDVVATSSFATTAELQAWLRRAFGKNLAWLRRAETEARLAVELCPLQGEGYVCLAQLSFLDGLPSAATKAYVEQSLRVRPHDADVLFEVGRQALVSSDLPTALERWSQCFGDAGPHQLRIVYLLAGRIPAAEFVATFHPEWPRLRDIWNRYRDAGRAEDLETLLKYATERTESYRSENNGVPPAYVWYWQSQLYADVGQADKVLGCLQHAYACDSRQYFIRYALAQALFATDRLAEAEPHFRWCLARRPSDKSLSLALKAISRARYAGRNVAMTTSQPGPPTGAIMQTNFSLAPH